MATSMLYYIMYIKVNIIEADSSILNNYQYFSSTVIQVQINRGDYKSLSINTSGWESIIIKMLITIILQYLMYLQRYNTHLNVCKCIF